MTAEELRAQINEATAPLMPGAESMAARLARVEAERDTLREVAQGNKRHVAQLIALYEAVEREREELARQAAECEDLRATVAMYRQQLRETAHDLEHVAAERDFARAELASARVELDHLRAERDAAFEAAAKPTENRG